MSAEQVPNAKLDLRLSPRKALRAHGTFVLDGHVLPFDAIDLGIDGVRIGLSRQLNPGQCCRIDLPLFVNGRRLDVAAMAKVTYCVCGRDGFKAGMQFVEMINKASSAAIAIFMK